MSTETAVKISPAEPPSAGEEDPPETFQRAWRGLLRVHACLARRLDVQLEQAHHLSPHDLVVVYAQRRLHWGDPLTERQAAQIFREVSSTLRGVRQR